MCLVSLWASSVFILNGCLQVWLIGLIKRDWVLGKCWALSQKQLRRADAAYLEQSIFTYFCGIIFRHALSGLLFVGWEPEVSRALFPPLPGNLLLLVEPLGQPFLLQIVVL